MPQFYCYHCGQHIDAHAELSGWEVDCPACGGALTVPGTLRADLAPDAELEFDFVPLSAESSLTEPSVVEKIEEKREPAPAPSPAPVVLSEPTPSFSPEPTAAPVFEKPAPPPEPPTAKAPAPTLASPPTLVATPHPIPSTPEPAALPGKPSPPPEPPTPKTPAPTPAPPPTPAATPAPTPTPSTPEPLSLPEKPALPPASVPTEEPHLPIAAAPEVRPKPTLSSAPPTPTATQAPSTGDSTAVAPPDTAPALASASVPEKPPKPHWEPTRKFVPVKDPPEPRVPMTTLPSTVIFMVWMLGGAIALVGIILGAGQSSIIRDRCGDSLAFLLACALVVLALMGLAGLSLGTLLSLFRQRKVGKMGSSFCIAVLALGVLLLGSGALWYRSGWPWLARSLNSVLAPFQVTTSSKAKDKSSDDDK